MSNRQTNLLVSPAFLAALGLLLANDFIFKPLFHNWFTGKLSDFAGLFAFFVFWSAFFPRRNRIIGLMVAVGFVFWKSAWSQPLIDYWNSLALYHIGRVVDATDLIALAILPGADFYTRRYGKQRASSTHHIAGVQARRLAICLMCGLSIFAFAATKFVNDRAASVYRDYEIALAKSDLLAKLHNIGLAEIKYWRSSDEDARIFYMTEEDRNKYDLVPATKFCKSSITAHVTLHDKNGKTVLKLKGIRFWCDQHTPQRDEEVLQIFEREVIEKLRAK
jgi:hypothetical protein